MTDDPHEEDPARVADRVLQHTAHREPEQAQHHGDTGQEIPKIDPDAAAAEKEHPELQDDPDPAAGRGGDGGAGDAHLREGTETMASVRQTVATASVPTLETKNASVRAKTDSITISRTIGIDRRMIDRPMGPVVKSSSFPARESLTVPHRPRSA